MLLKGVISTFNREYVRITDADEGLSLKWQYALEGLLKFFYG